MAYVVSVPARRLLAAVCLAIAMVAVAALGPGSASASHDGYVDVGSTANTASATTGVTTTAGNALQGVTGDESASGLYGQNDAQGFGVAGRSLLGQELCSPVGFYPCTGVLGEGLTGVKGVANVVGGVGVTGEGGIGVVGAGQATALTPVGVRGTGQIAVQAKAFFHRPGSVGVEATSQAGTAVRASGGVVGVEAESPNTALKVIGESSFSRSGRVTIVAGSTSVVVPAVPLDGTSMVLATLQNNRVDTWIKAAVPSATNDTITISLNRQAPQDTRVAWLVIELP